MLRLPYSLRRGVRRRLVFAPLRGERSAGRCRGLRDPLSGRRGRPTRLARRVLSVGATERRLSALHCGDFGLRVRASWDEATCQSQSSRAPCGGVLVPPGRVPGPPECGVTSPARGRRANRYGFPRPARNASMAVLRHHPRSRLLHHRDVSRRRPQPSKAAWNKVLDCGDSMTIFLDFHRREFSADFVAIDAYRFFAI